MQTENVTKGKKVFELGLNDLWISLIINIGIAGNAYCNFKLPRTLFSMMRSSIYTS